MPLFQLARLTPPATEPVTLAEAKLFLRVDQSAEDAPITAMIAAARLAAEAFTRRSLVTQAWRLDLEADGCPVPLPMGPVQAISAASAIDNDGVATTVAPAAYRLDAGRVIWESLPSHARVRIDYTAGYGAAASVPEAIRQAVLAQALWLYDRRGDGEWSPQALALLMPYRETRL